jgi:beta-lactamase superfamily II metal-dependent hydrolase
MHYREISDSWLEQVNLGLTIWQGEFEGIEESWLRWRDASGEVLLTGDEQAERERQQVERERQRAERERQQAERERQRADEQQQRAERLAEFLRSQGIDPDQLPE